MKKLMTTVSIPFLENLLLFDRYDIQIRRIIYEFADEQKGRFRLILTGKGLPDGCEIKNGEMIREGMPIYHREKSGEVNIIKFDLLERPKPISPEEFIRRLNIPLKDKKNKGL